MTDKMVNRISLIAMLIMVLIIGMYTCKRESEYEERLEQEQLNEMRIAHSSRGLTSIEDGVLIIKLDPEFYEEADL